MTRLLRISRFEATLARYAEAILEILMSPLSTQMMRMAVTSAIDMPELAPDGL